MAYIYKHTRVDKGEIFYIGIGNQDKYKRAFVTQKRNKFWKNVVSKTEYIVEIIEDGLTWEEACKKEIELIKFYGRRDLRLGTLVNLTDGGDGTIGIIHTEQWYQNQRKTNNKKGKSISEEHKKKISDNHKSKRKDYKSGNKAIDVFDKEWNYINSYNSILEASKELKIGRWIIDKFLAGDTKRPYKYRFKYKI